MSLLKPDSQTVCLTLSQADIQSSSGAQHGSRIISWHRTSNAVQAINGVPLLLSVKEAVRVVCMFNGGVGVASIANCLTRV